MRRFPPYQKRNFWHLQQRSDSRSEKLNNSYISNGNAHDKPPSPQRKKTKRTRKNGKHSPPSRGFHLLPPRRECGSCTPDTPPALVRTQRTQTRICNRARSAAKISGLRALKRVEDSYGDTQRNQDLRFPAALPVKNLRRARKPQKRRHLP